MEVHETTLFGAGGKRDLPQFIEEFRDIYNLVSYYLQNSSDESASLTLVEYNQSPYESIVCYIDCNERMLRWMETAVTTTETKYHVLEVFNNKTKFNEFCEQNASEMI